MKLNHLILFYFPITRSKTCPQCRAPTANKDFHLLYFNVASNDNSLSYHNDSISQSLSSSFSQEDEIRVLRDSLEQKEEILESYRNVNSGLMAENEKNELALMQKDEKIAELENEIDVMRVKVAEMEALVDG